MCMCIRSLLALIVILFFPIPLIIPIFLLCVHNLFFPPSIISIFNVLIDNSMIYSSNVDLAVKTTCLICSAAVLIIFFS